MSDKITLELDSAAIQELLKSKEVAELCGGIAREIAGRVGDCTTDSQTGKYRSITRVTTTNKKKHKALISAVKGG